MKPSWNAINKVYCQIFFAKNQRKHYSGNSISSRWIYERPCPQLGGDFFNCPPIIALNLSSRHRSARKHLSPANVFGHSLLLYKQKQQTKAARLLHKQKHQPEGWCFCLAPRVGFEPTTPRLTAAYSTVELSRNIIPAATYSSRDRRPKYHRRRRA